MRRPGVLPFVALAALINEACGASSDATGDSQGGTSGEGGRASGGTSTAGNPGDDGRSGEGGTAAAGASGEGGSAAAGAAGEGGSAAAGQGGKGGAAAAMCTADKGGVAYSKYKTAFFGNLHQHTANSLDAFAFGTRAKPADAYLFAKKKASIQVGTGTDAAHGPKVEIDRPLDFLAITDHSEWLGIVDGCNDPKSSLYKTENCATVRSQNTGDQSAVFGSMGKYYTALCGSASATAAECKADQRTAWLEEQTAAAQAYEPCSFTSFIAYEWTSSINGDNNHHNVIFANDVVPANPLDSQAYSTRVDLYKGLDKQCTGACSAIVAPHNSNQSAGVSLTVPSTASEQASMEKYQRLVEIYQHKGASECFYDPGKTDDPLCVFEYLNPGAANDTPASYVRTALAKGMEYAASHKGVNPLQLGIIASVDDHNAAAGYVAEDGYVGHLGRLDDTAEKRLSDANRSQYGSGGLAVVWAEENTRESIFSALMRRETYGVSGPRIQVRFYETTSANPCTADFPQTIVDAKQAVPMGGTFTGKNVIGGVPVFAIAAWPDPSPQALANGTKGVAGLSKAQVIKAHGVTKITEDPPVDIPLSPTGQCVTWKDPKFDAKERAFYYVRVLQEATWRWSHFDCEGSSDAACKSGGKLDRLIDERAWTSPIWFVP